MIKLTSKHTRLACYMSTASQAAVLNFPPLLFVRFGEEFGIGLAEAGLLVMINFATQLVVDSLSLVLSRWLGGRFSLVLTNGVSALGFAALACLPSLIDPYIGLCIGMMLLGVGSGLCDILVSPLLEACSADDKSGQMSLMHSIGCWTAASVVLLSTLFFLLFGVENWRTMAFIWLLLPLSTAIFMSLVPIYRTTVGKGRGLIALFKDPVFLLYIPMMIAAGASEQTMSQWASTFAETGLGLTKAVGDIVGPCLFAAALGTSRALYAKFSSRVAPHRAIMLCTVGCSVAYLVTAFIPNSAVSIVGCIFCGLFAGIFWPATLSRASGDVKGGGIALFAMLAFGGDVGCVTGPGVAGAVAEAFGDLRASFAVSAVYPMIMLACSFAVVWVLSRKDKQKGVDFNGLK